VQQEQRGEAEVDELLDAAVPKPKRKRDGDDANDMLPDGKQAKLEEELTEDELHTLEALTAAMDEDDDPAAMDSNNGVQLRNRANQNQYGPLADVIYSKNVSDIN
jgi:hypothetical protein